MQKSIFILTIITSVIWCSTCNKMEDEEVMTSPQCLEQTIEDPKLVRWQFEFTGEKPDARFQMIGHTKAFLVKGNKIFWTENTFETIEEVAQLDLDSIHSFHFYDISRWLLVENYFDDDGFSRAKLYQTDDGGQNWEIITSDHVLTENWVSSFNFINDSLGFANAARFDANSDFKNHALIRTIDGGNTWHSIYPLIAMEENSDKIQFISPNVGFLIAGNQLLKTTDTGNNWFDIGTPETLKDFYVVNKDYLIVSTGEGVWRSINGGGLWVRIIASPGQILDATIGRCLIYSKKEDIICEEGINKRVHQYYEHIVHDFVEGPTTYFDKLLSPVKGQFDRTIVLWDEEIVYIKRQ